MTKVFFELGFVRIENGLTTVVENAPKRALTEAPSYKMRSEQIEFEQKLLYATYIELKQWFDERMQCNVLEEDIKMDLKQYVTTVENWPKEGISFKDITTIMDNGPAYKYATDQIVEYAKEVGAEIIVGPEARGFIIGCPVAYALEIGFAPVRKAGKLTT